MSAAYRCFASCAFELEAVMARELKDLRFNDIAARDARVYFWRMRRVLPGRTCGCALRTACISNWRFFLP